MVVVVVEKTRHQGRSPHFNSFHKQGGWTLALTAARLGILEKVEMVVCISVVAVVLTSTVESTIFISFSTVASNALILASWSSTVSSRRSEPVHVNNQWPKLIICVCAPVHYMYYDCKLYCMIIIRCSAC